MSLWSKGVSLYILVLYFPVFDSKNITPVFDCQFSLLAIDY